jgi:ankyrin repeat protein
VFTKALDFDHVVQIPPALRVKFLQELTKKANDPTDPLCVSSLLSLAYCRSLGFTVGDDVSRDFSLEAARLGSIIGKHITLLWSVMQRTPPPIDNREESEWMLDALLTRMSSKNDFKQRVLDAFPDVTLIGNQLLRVFEQEMCRTRVIGKTFKVEGGEADIRDMFSAAISGQAVRLRSLLSNQHKDQHKDILNMRLHGFNLLHAASEYGQVIVLRLLIQEFGMDPNELNDDGVSAVALAMRADERNAWSALLALKADYKSMLSIRTLRYLANYTASLPIREIYNLASLPNKYPGILEPFPLQAYLDGDLAVLPDTEKDDDEPDLPPIFAAILGDNMSSLWTLLELGCSRDIHTKFSSGCLAPIHVAANLRPLHLALLLHYGALPDLRTKDSNQWTALHLACNARTIPKYQHPRVQTQDLLPEDSPLCGLLGLQPEDYLEAKLCMIRLLVKVYGADVNAQDWVGSTAISHCMSPQGDLTVARYLVEECDADIHIKDFRGLSCIHRAVINRAEPEYLKFCIEMGLSINEKDINGLTPLMMAAVTAKVDISRTLVNLGADLLATNMKGWTCFDLAILGGHLEVFGNLFQVAEELGILSAVVAIEDEARQTLLHKITQKGEDLTKVFIRRIPKEAIALALEKPDIVGFTLLHHAVLAGNLDAAEFLLQHRSDTDAKGYKQLTPLHIAYATGNKKIIQLLECSGGIDQKATDLEGRTPVDYERLAAADNKFFNKIVASYSEDSKQRVGLPRIDEAAIVEENRRKGQPSGGWLSY